MNEILTEPQIRQIALALSPHYPEGVPEEVFDMAVDWIVTLRVHAAMADLILAGDVSIYWGADDWHLCLDRRPAVAR